jgi:hypothetical protein
MSIKADVENLIIQLDYPLNDSTKKQLEDIANNTNEFFSFAGHIFSLKDDLKRIDGTVAMSNSNNYLKIKSNSKIDLELAEFNEIANAWAQKYKVELKKVDNKNTYYIIGKNS